MTQVGDKTKKGGLRVQKSRRPLQGYTEGVPAGVNLPTEAVLINGSNYFAKIVKRKYSKIQKH